MIRRIVNRRGSASTVGCSVECVEAGFQPRGQSVDRSPGVARHGQTRRDDPPSGMGLVPEDIVSIPATPDGRVERKLLARHTGESRYVLLELDQSRAAGGTRGCRRGRSRPLRRVHRFEVRLESRGSIRAGAQGEGKGGGLALRNRTTTGRSCGRTGRHCSIRWPDRGIDVEDFKEADEDLANRYAIDKRARRSGESIQPMAVSERGSSRFVRPIN